MLHFFDALPTAMLPTLRVGIIFLDFDFRFFNTSAVGMLENLLFSKYPIYLLFLIVYCARAALAVTPRLGLMACGSTCLNKTVYLDTPVAWIVPSLAWSFRV